MAKISMAGLEPADVDLWGRDFVTIPATKSVLEAVAGLEKELGDAEGNDQAFDVLVKIVDLRLKPKGQGRKSAGEILREKWDADELPLVQLEHFLAQLEGADRPT